MMGSIPGRVPGQMVSFVLLLHDLGIDRVFFSFDTPAHIEANSSAAAAPVDMYVLSIELGVPGSLVTLVVRLKGAGSSPATRRP